MEGISILNSESPNPEVPTVAHLQEARLKRWHQTGEALLTVENLRSWINAAGLVLFAPRPQVVAPAPTFVEAVLGAPNQEPTLQMVGEARNLLARLVAEGVALPLNLMGTHGVAGDTPDFVVSAAVFSYVFTLRGDKAWKQPPGNSGPNKVSNLALAAYQTLSSSGPMSAYDLATQLGKEVTETACLRALNELWTHLRVTPLIQTDDRATLWELISSRFTKQIKAGANAGQPTALSALISLYLGQAIIASEDEVESFLSPLAPRSRIREVTHALLSARQLDTLVVEGKTSVHVSGEAPSFAAAAPAQIPATLNGEAGQADSSEESTEGSRIEKYVPRPRKIGTGYLAKGKPALGKRPFERGDSRGPAGRSRPPVGGRDERERRPFRKLAEDAPKRSFHKPTDRVSERRFDRPWEEDRPKRGAEGASRSPRQVRSEGHERASDRPPFRSGPRPPRRDGDRPERRPRRDEHPSGEIVVEQQLAVQPAADKPRDPTVEAELEGPAPTPVTEQRPEAQ